MNEDSDIIIGSLYVPPSISRFFNDDEFQCLGNEIFEKCSNFKYCILIGDVNGHTSNLPDFIEMDDLMAREFNLDDDFLKIFNSDISVDTLTSYNFPRNRESKDNKTNSVGLQFLELLSCNNLFIINGRTKDDHLGNLTFRDVSVIDYAVASLHCFPFIQKFCISESETLLSDVHSILTLHINIPVLVEKSTDTEAPLINNDQHIKPPKWQSDLKEQ
jgi:hypothetical protein